MDILKQFGNVEISFDSDRDYTNLESMIRYSKKLEQQLEETQAKLDKAVAEIEGSIKYDNSWMTQDLLNEYAEPEVQRYVGFKKLLKEIKDA